MNRLILSLMFISCSIANAQFCSGNLSGVGWGYGNFATSGPQSYLTGVGNAKIGQGYLVQSQAIANVYNQQAREMSIHNWELQADTTQRLRMQYKEYLKWKYPTYLEHRMKALDTAELQHAVKMREADLINKGVLPPKKPTVIRFNGQEYSSMEDLRQSQDGQLLKEIGLKAEQSRNIDTFLHNKLVNKYIESHATELLMSDSFNREQERYLENQKRLDKVGENIYNMEVKKNEAASNW